MEHILKLCMDNNLQVSIIPMHSGLAVTFTKPNDQSRYQIIISREEVFCQGTTLESFIIHEVTKEFCLPSTSTLSFEDVASYYPSNYYMAEIKIKNILERSDVMMFEHRGSMTRTYVSRNQQSPITEEEKDFIRAFFRNNDCIFNIEFKIEEDMKNEK